MPTRHPLDPVALTEALVAIDSRNPELVPGAPGEQACAAHLADVLADWGFAVAVTAPKPGRPNVIARIGPSGAPPLLLNGHLDVVGTEGMTHAPFEPRRDGGRLYGRGAADMKGGIAAMCTAAARAHARGRLRGEIMIAAVCDEEYLSAGTRALLAGGLAASGVIVTEPTRLAVCPAHKGFVWLEVTVHGRAAHGSRHDVGIDAVTHAGLLLAALDAHQRTVLASRTHPLLGRGSRHAATIRGGTAWSTYPDRCTIRLERRTLPGVTGAMAVAEVRQAIDALAAERDGFEADVRLVAEQPPSDLSPEAPLAVALSAALATHGRPAPIEGLACWTDAALFTQAGVPALCFGPGDIALAHGAEEWVPIDEIEVATDVLETVCSTWHERVAEADGGAGRDDAGGVA